MGEVKSVNYSKKLDFGFRGKGQHMPFKHGNHIIKVSKILLRGQCFPVFIHSYRAVSVGLGKVKQGSKLASRSVSDIAPHKLVNKCRFAHTRRALNDEDTAPSRITRNRRVWIGRAT